ncbi:MAG TPA: polysaccharide deacetylase family protein [Micromonosporaceae bacterium]|nr:polysaccharide deacetylase family protein [Micromonosporaceae bacterium]
MTVVAVLGYHSVGDAPRDGTLRWSVSSADFDEQMALLRQRGCTPLTVSGYAELLRLGGPMPPKPVLVTFDDGFPDLATAALPILQRYGIAATAYVITSRVGTPPRPGADPSLDWDQLAGLRGNGVEIGSHSHTHRALDCLRPAELHEEVVVSKRVLEDGLRERVDTFAYPYGYHSAAVRRTVRAAGYTSACAVKNALSHLGDDPFAVARVLVERGTGAAGVDAALAGAGWPLAWPGERLRTRGWRAYRRARHVWQRVARRSARAPRTGGDAP